MSPKQESVFAFIMWVITTVVIIALIGAYYYGH